MSIDGKSFGFRVGQQPAAAEAGEFMAALRKAHVPRGAQLRGRVDESGGVTLFIAPGARMMSIAAPAQRAASLAAQEALVRLFPGLSFSARAGGIDVHAVLRLLASYPAQDSAPGPGLRGGDAKPVGLDETGPARPQPAPRDGLFGDGDEVFEFPEIGTGAVASRRTSSLSDSSVEVEREGKSSSGRRSLSSASELTDTEPADAARERKGSPDGAAQARPLRAGDHGTLSAGLFKDSKAEESGGKTGSKRRWVTLDGLAACFQLKTRASELRAKFKGGRHAENFAEVIASKVARAVNTALAGATAGAAVQSALVADVSLVIDSDKCETCVASRYVCEAPTPTLDKHAQAHGFDKNRVSGHVRLLLNTPAARQMAPADLPADLMPLSGPASADTYRNIALSALVNDHDVNPGNMMVLGSQDPASARVARIDFGHAFGDLTSASPHLGGGQRDPNTVRDFFNRERVAGTSPGGSLSKLWRDYVGLLPSHGLAEALRDVAASQAIGQGLAQARAQFEVLAQTLEAGPPETRKAREAETAEVLRSLAGLCAKFGAPADFSGQDLSRAIDTAFGHLGIFLARQQADMAQVAEQCKLQALIDDAILAPPADGAARARLEQEIASLYQSLGAGGGPLTWLKAAADRPAHAGTLASYREHRSSMLGATPPPAGGTPQPAGSRPGAPETAADLVRAS